MSTTSAAFQRDEAEVFYYGFLSSRTSGILETYLDKKQMADSSREVLTNASHLLMDILAAQKLFGQGKECVAPSEPALDSFRCALEVISQHGHDFNVKKVEDLGTLFQTLDSTLGRMLEGGTPPTGDIRTTRAFFKGLSELMLAQLSVPEEEETSSS